MHLRQTRPRRSAAPRTRATAGCCLQLCGCFCAASAPGRRSTSLPLGLPWAQSQPGCTFQRHLQTSPRAVCTPRLARGTESAPACSARWGVSHRRQTCEHNVQRSKAHRIQRKVRILASAVKLLAEAVAHRRQAIGRNTCFRRAHAARGGQPRRHALVGCRGRFRQRVQPPPYVVCLRAVAARLRAVAAACTAGSAHAARGAGTPHALAADAAELSRSRRLAALGERDRGGLGHAHARRVCVRRAQQRYPHHSAQQLKHSSSTPKARERSGVPARWRPNNTCARETDQPEG